MSRVRSGGPSSYRWLNHLVGLFLVLGLLMVRVSPCSCSVKAVNAGEHECCRAESTIQAPFACSDGCSSAKLSAASLSNEAQGRVDVFAAPAGRVQFQDSQVVPFASADPAIRTGRPPEPPLILRV
jgi:hypothetical protein